MIIHIRKIVFGSFFKRWCDLEYPDHSRGCPKTPRCHYEAGLFEDRVDLTAYEKTKEGREGNIFVYELREGFEPTMDLVVFKFDLAKHVAEMKKRPRKDGKKWTDRQARCVLYWQEHKVDKPLRAQANMHKWSFPYPTVVLEVPEIWVNLFATCRHHGLQLEKNPQNIVYKMMMVARPKY